MFEFLSASRVPREESDDLARIMDSDSDGVVTVEELMSSVDNCPVPDIQPAPIVNTRPRVNFQGKCNKLVCLCLISKIFTVLTLCNLTDNKF